jgi:hypothetical protein
MAAAPNPLTDCPAALAPFASLALNFPVILISTGVAMTISIDYSAILKRKLATMFPDAAIRAAVEAELSRYGTESYEQGAARVRLAVLKLAGTSLEKLREHVDMAKRDYRDVLAMAEYPVELVNPTWRQPQDQVEGIRHQDFQQYHEWLEE